MDPPDLFSGLYEPEDDVSDATQLPQERRSPAVVTSPMPTDRGLNVKPGVSLNLAGEMAPALQIVSARGDVITSGSEGRPGDGVHSPQSLHYDGRALDIRPAKDRLAQIARYRHAGYRVLDEGDHLHVSYDPAGLRA